MMNININDYISEEEKKEIARDAFRESCLNMSKDAERVLSNTAYRVIVEMINEQIDGEVEKIIRDKAIELIDKLCVYTAFKTPDYWNKSSKGWDVLQTALKENQQKANDKVASLIDSLNDDDTRVMMRDVACDLIDEKLFGARK